MQLIGLTFMLPYTTVFIKLFIKQLFTEGEVDTVKKTIIKKDQRWYMSSYTIDH